MAAPAKTSPFGKPSKDEAFTFPIPRGNDVIPDGKYEVKLTGMSRGPSQASGNDMITWNFVIVKGPHAGLDFPVFTSLTQAAAWKFNETLEALGIDVPEDEDDMTINKKEVLGRYAVAVIIAGVQQKGKRAGKKRSAIESLEPHPKGAGYKPKGVTGNVFTDKDVGEDPDEEEETAEAEGIEEGEEEAEETTDEGEEEGEEATDEEAEEDEVEAEEEEEEEPPPPPVKKKASVSTPARAPSPAPVARKTPPGPPRPRR